MDCLDLFSGAGGLTAGLHAAGFNTVAAVEMDSDCCETYSNAFPTVDLKCELIQGINFTAYQGIDLLAGGPPCQPFSSGGKRLADRDERDMLPQFLRAVKESRPRAFLLENVAGLVATKNKEYFNYVKTQLEEYGYSVTSQVVNAAHYGVPQKRRRLFVIGIRGGNSFSFPTPSHGPGAKKPYVPAGKFISCNKVRGEENTSKVVYAKNPDLRPSPYDGHLFNGGGRAINLNEPSHTILASAGGNKTHFVDTLNEVPPYHDHLLNGGNPRQGTLPGGRRLSILESGLLQTFPVSMKFFGSKSSQYTQIGNAVPPLLAQVLGKSLKKHLN